MTFLVLFGVLQLAKAYTPKRNSTKNTPKDVVPAKDVPFGGPDDYILYLDLKFPKNRHFGPILTGLSFFAAENRFNMGML